jgi:hypothetical protein
VYTEVREGGHYDSGAHWGDIQGLVDSHGLSCTENADQGGGFQSSISTGSDTSPIVEATLYLA